MRIATSSNIRRVVRALESFEKKHLPEIEMRTVNNLANDAKKVASRVVRQKFNGKSLSKAIVYKKATLRKHYAEIYISDRVRWKENALTTLGLSGDRARKSTERMLIRARLMKPSEILIPDEKINGGVYTKVLSQLRLFNRAGSDANETSASRTRNNAKRGIKSKFFLVTSRHIAYVNDLGRVKKRKSGLAPGVYVVPYETVRDENNDKALSRANDKPIRILKIANKPNYEQKWDLDTIVRDLWSRKRLHYRNDAIKHIKRKLKWGKK